MSSVNTAAVEPTRAMADSVAAGADEVDMVIDIGLLKEGRADLVETRRVDVHGDEVLGEERGPKIVIQKFKNKTGYKKRQGHRQDLTRVKITGIK